VVNYSGIGIMGGTFDPIHYGHLVTAETARDILGLEKVIFVPAGKPPHKKGYRVTQAYQRLKMVELAINTNPYFEASDTEIRRPGYSYTVDTVLEFHNLYGDRKKLFFITGADAILEILTWRDVERIFDYCSFIAATRPGVSLKGLEEFKTKLGSRAEILLLEVPALAISSTDIRSRVQKKRSIRYLLPDEVREYINEHHLYLNRDS